MLSTILYHISLKDSRPAENRHRVYTIIVSEKTGHYTIKLLWGRRGAYKQWKIEQCETEERVTSCIHSILKTRLKHGYVLVESSKQTPHDQLLSAFKQESLWGERQLQLF